MSAFRHKLRNTASFGERHLTLGDNLGVELIMTKGRGSNFQMLVCCRRIFCLELVSGARLSHRWIPSELNRADSASPWWEPNNAKQRFEHSARRVAVGPDGVERGGDQARGEGFATCSKAPRQGEDRGEALRGAPRLGEPPGAEGGEAAEALRRVRAARVQGLGGVSRRRTR